MADVVPRPQRQLLMARCGGRCERCSSWTGLDPHHRRLRGMGGSSNPERHDLSNLVALCRPCHRWVHLHRPAAEPDGWIVPRSQAPADIPVLISGTRRRLLDDGTYEEVTNGDIAV